MEITAKLVKELRDLTGSGMMDCKKALIENDGDIDRAVRWLQEQGIAKSAKKSGRIAAEGLVSVKTKGNLGVLVEINAETDFVAKNEMFLNLVESVSTALVENNPADLDAAKALVVDGRTLDELVVEATATIGERIDFRRFTTLEKTDDQTFGQYVHMGGKIAALTVVSGTDEFARDMAMQVASMSPQYVSQDVMPASIVDEQTSIQTEILKNDPVLSQKNEKQQAGIVKGRVSKALQEISLVDQVYFKDQNMKVGQLLKQEKFTVHSFARYAVGEGIEKREDNFADEVASMTKQ
ncbi:MAG TPA: elongation factor Ts [Erysipelothrix sp.]|nr:elongation factor Ts [Erysipelothrix sp.]